ncbi:polysaccharide deacetylase family protein [Massilia sp. W12]|uniref:polysaccharide deacetylase family protein n=1 Tax=Massilia sp. W12 TaxID=3126507 RepID=UPI0030CA806D
MACISTITRRASKRAAALALAAPLCGGATPCPAQIYLTFDTGNMAQAEFIAGQLRQRQIAATFFLANERTTRGDYALDDSWAGFWRQLSSEGHAFGSHSISHARWLADGKDGRLVMRPQFGPQAGQSVRWDQAQFCQDLQQARARFFSLTGRHSEPLWRAPGGHVSARSLDFGRACGLQHVGWSPAGFSGDEQSSERYPNPVLLKRLLHNLKAGDVVMAHLGIWSRRDPWAPAVLPPLLDGLRARGFCFATLREHPAYRLSPKKE